jgi:hypothetical protein
MSDVLSRFEAVFRKLQDVGPEAIQKVLTKAQFQILTEDIPDLIQCCSCRGSSTYESYRNLRFIAFDDGNNQLLCQGCMKKCHVCDVFYHEEATQSTGDHSECEELSESELQEEIVNTRELLKGLKEKRQRVKQRKRKKSEIKN